MEKKITKREMFARIMEVAEVKANEEMTKFLAREIELLENRANSKKNKENEEVTALKNTTYDILCGADEPMTCSEIAKRLDISTQKATPILTKLIADKLISKEKDGKTFVYKAV